jgi:hypothetical protein
VCPLVAKDHILVTNFRFQSLAEILEFKRVPV